MQQAIINYILIKNVRLEKHDQKACGAIVLVPPPFWWGWGRGG